MKRILLKILAALWLLIVTPLFGVLPLFCLLPFTEITKSFCHLEMALLWELIGLFGADTPPDGVMDVWPPITSLQLGLIGITVLAISVGALFVLFNRRNRQGRIAVSQ